MKAETPPLAAQEAAMQYCDKVAPSISWSYTHRRAIEVAFIAGWQAHAGQPVVVTDEAYRRDVVEPNVAVYGADVEAARNVLKNYRKGQWHINGQIVREALDAAYSAVGFMDEAMEVTRALHKQGDGFWHGDCGLKGDSPAWKHDQTCANCRNHELAARLEAVLKVLQPKEDA